MPSGVYERSEKFCEYMRKRMSGAGNPMFGKSHHPDSIELIRKKAQERVAAPGYVNPFKDKTHTGESRQRISKVLLELYENGYVQSEEQREKNRQANSGENSPNYGKTRTLESRKRQSDSGKGKHSGSRNGMYGKNHKPETIEKVSGPNHWNWNPDREQVALVGAAWWFGVCCKDRGYSWDEHREDIERKFYWHPIYGEMVWSKRGWGPGTFQVHHIDGVADQVKRGITDPKELHRLENLQPMWFDHHMEAHHNRESYEMMEL